MTEPSPNRRRHLVMLCVAMAVPVAAGFLLGLTVPRSLIVVPVAIACGGVAGYAMVKLRPGTASAMAAPIAVLVVASLSGAGTHSLWFTAFGETRSCVVTEVNTHVNRRSPTSYTNDLDCGGLRVDRHSPKARPLGEPGERRDLVVDRLGVMYPLEPSRVTWWRDLLVPASAVIAAGFVVLVLRRRQWRPTGKPPRKKLSRDFL